MYGAGMLSDNLEKAFEDRDIFRDDVFHTPMQALDALMSKRQIWNQPVSGKHAGLRFSSEMILAINAKSKVAEEAWKFMSYLLSEEAQSNPAMFMMFPMNKASVAVKLKEASLGGGNSGTTDGSSDKAKLPAEATAQDVERLMAYIGQPGYFHGSDPRLLDIVETETAAFFAGEKQRKL